MAMAMGAACRCRQRQCWLQWQALAQLSLLLLQISSSTAFITIYPPTMNILSPAEHSHHHPSIHPNSRRSSPSLHPRSSVCNGSTRKIIQLSSSWDNFAYDDDDGLDDDGTLMLETPNFVPADENDDPSVKAAAGMSLQPPEVDYDGPVIDVPQGSTLELDEETVQGVLAACRQEIGTMFGYQAENRGVGITGGVDFVELDGPTVVLHLKGRFWHQRPTVLKRVGAYLMARIPEIVDVIVADEYELTDEANNDAI